MKTIITKVKEFFAFINAKLVLVFLSGMLFLFLIGRVHGRHERFNHGEKFGQQGMSKGCVCEGENFRFEGHQKFRPEMGRGMRFNSEMRGRGFNPEMRGRGFNSEMRGRGFNPEMRGRGFNPEMKDSMRSRMKDSTKFHKLSFHQERTINRIPIMLQEIEIIAPKLSYIHDTNMIGEVEVFAQKIS